MHGPGCNRVVQAMIARASELSRRLDSAQGSCRQPLTNGREMSEARLRGDFSGAVSTVADEVLSGL